MTLRTILEWEHIGYGTGENELLEAQADQLAAVARTSTFAGRGGEGVLEHRRRELRARGVVGVIATSGCQLEILPKIDCVGEIETDSAALRHRLVHMLAVARDIQIDAMSNAQLGWQRNTILELLIRLFCRKLADAVRQGIPQQYAEQKEDLPALRGCLDVTRQFSTLAVPPQRLACRFDARSPDIALNQVMRAAIGKLSRFARDPDNQRALRELNFAYAEISEVAATALRWDRIALDRTNTRWRELLSLARNFLGERHQQTTTGLIEGLPLLFEMNALFEEYVGRVLARALTGTGLRVTAQGGHRDCLYEDQTGRFRTRPDLIVRQDGQNVLIIDTKWKRIKRTEDPKGGVSQADVYQMMAYSQLYDCKNVVLLYPHHRDLPPESILQRYSIVRPDAQESLFVATLDVAGSQSSQESALRRLMANLLDQAVSGQEATT